MSPSTNTLIVFLTWLVSEVVFVVVFYRIWLPRFQRLRPPAEYRDYAKDRYKLFLRIINRMEKQCKEDNKPFLPKIQSFFREWFPTSTPDFLPKKGDMDQFFAWAFFGKEYNELEPWMHHDIDKMYEYLESEHNLSFPEGSTPEYKSMRLSLDPLTPGYRPFLIYAILLGIKVMGRLLLRTTGFSCRKTKGGLKYFYRPPKRESDQTNKLPIIFLHGIAPGGLTFYIPMLFRLGDDGRPLFLFENPDITFSIFGGNPLNEHDTVEGMWEAVDHHLSSVQDVSVVGHSFGSCPITWLVHSHHRARIRQIVLVDPVSICLSEPDVMYNFLYNPNTRVNKKIPLAFVSKELFIQHYLRRHFAWYNSELWLEDLPQQAKVLVCLSEYDPIVPVHKVRQLLRRKPEVENLFWERAGHAHCVFHPQQWQEMAKVMRLQEQVIRDETSKTLSLSDDLELPRLRRRQKSRDDDPFVKNV